MIKIRICFRCGRHYNDQVKYCVACDSHSVVKPNQVEAKKKQWRTEHL